MDTCHSARHQESQTLTEAVYLESYRRGGGVHERGTRYRMGSHSPADVDSAAQGYLSAGDLVVRLVSFTLLVKRADDKAAPLTIRELITEVDNGIGLRHHKREYLRDMS
jgi:hypothetical protein